MKKRILIVLLFLSQFCLGQTYFDSLYNFERGAKVFTHVFLTTGYDTSLVLASSNNFYASDSNYFSHVKLYKISNDGNKKEVAHFQKNKWGISTYGPVPFEPEQNRFMYITNLDTSTNSSLYRQVYYCLASTNDDWKTNNVSKFNLPFKRYFLRGCLKSNFGYVFTGDTDMYSDSKCFILGCDSNFNVKWFKVFSFQCDIQSILPATNGYILTGFKDGSFDARMWQGKVDTIGNIIWQKDFLDTSKYYSSGFFNEGVVLNNAYYNCGTTCGNVNNFNSGNRMGYLNAIDDGGNQIFEKFYPYHFNFSLNKIISRNNFIYAIGQLDSMVYPDTNGVGRLAYFCKIKPNGDIAWYQIYKHWSQQNTLVNVYSTDKGFLMCGTAINQNRIKEFDSTHITESDAWLLRVDTNGCIIPGCKPNLYQGVQYILDDNSLLEVFPNPATNEFIITLKGDRIINLPNEIFLYDLNGIELFNQKLKSNQSSITIQRTFNYSGLAFVVVRNQLGTFYKKIILL